jgi:hypothetical protein
MTIATMTAAFIRHAAACGFEIEHVESGLSASEYVSLTAPDGERYKMRFSDHSARPTYELQHGAAYAEFGPHSTASVRHWSEVLADLAAAHSLPTSAALRSMATRNSNARAAAEARIAAQRASDAAARRATLANAAARRAWGEMHHPEIIAEMNDPATSSNRRHRLADKLKRLYACA